MTPKSMTDPNLFTLLSLFLGKMVCLRLCLFMIIRSGCVISLNGEKTDNGRQTIDRVLTGIAKRMGVL